MSVLRQANRLISGTTARALGRTWGRRGFATEHEMSFTLAAANQVFYDKAAVKQVDVPTFSGSFGILPNHVPLLAVLKPGVVTVFEQDGKVSRIFVSSGTVTINDDSSVQVLAEEACDVNNIDPSAAQEVFSTAQREASSASSEREKAEAAIAVEVGESLVKAVS